VVVWTILGFYIGNHLGIAEGKIQGAKEALKTNPVSEELEITCAALWVGDQNKKAVEKNK
jgi:hypothetical protein